MKIETQYIEENEIELARAAEMLRQGKTVVFPTETVYGLGANALDEKAVEKIFAAKGRPSDNPLIVHISDLELLPRLVGEIPPNAELLMKKFWPGPLTLIFPKGEAVPKAVTGGLDTVAIRMPSHPTAKRLLELAKVPVAAPSANRSGFPSPTVFSHVKEDMDGRVDGIIMGGDCEVGVESTVLDLSGAEPILYRPGGVTVEELETTIGPIRVVTEVAEGEVPKSPGLKYRHYAPGARVQILHGTTEQVQQYAKNCCDHGLTGMLTFDEFPVFDQRLLCTSLGSKTNPQSAAHRLFASLRQLDEEGVALILAPEIPNDGVWRAVRNRLYRAAGECIINLENLPMRVLFVCTGNTCRSPMAEGILRQMMEKKGIPVQVSSAGVMGDHSPISSHAATVLAEEGIDMKSFQSRQVTGADLESADLILTMTKGHQEILQAICPQGVEKIKTLAEWAGEQEDVTDPYGGSVDTYRGCRNQIKNLLERGCRRFL